MDENNDEFRLRRASRYQKAQQRRAVQKAEDGRFYNVVFSLVGLMVLLALSIAALSIKGVAVDVSVMDGWTTPWLGPFSKIEVAGLVLIAIIAFFMYRRITKR